MVQVRQTKEVWIPVRGYENLYLVSNLGRVKGLKTGKIRKPGRLPKTGYLYVPLYKNNKQENRYVHRMVCEAFNGKPSRLRNEARHLDGDPENNVPKNLKWGTSKENHADKERHGTSNKGERHGLSKLSDKQAARVIRLCMLDYSAEEVALMLNTTLTPVVSIRAGRTYKHIDRNKIAASLGSKLKDDLSDIVSTGYRHRNLKHGWT